LIAPQFKQHFKFGEPKQTKIESYIHNPPTIVTTFKGALALDSHKIKVTTYEVGLTKQGLALEKN
jgi:hypothetical protein